jgi:hypothetical protein
MGCSFFGPARWMQSETYIYYGQMKIGVPADIPNFNSSYLVGKGFLYFRRSGKVAEGWWNG